MIGADAYEDAAKDTWRGWKWNRIAELTIGNLRYRRLPPSERSRQLSQKTVLYLVGPEDRDRRKALSLGFANHNLIAVDVVDERVQAVRDSGGFAVRGSLQQVLMHWPADWPIDVLDADLCCGMVGDVIWLPHVLHGSPAVHGNSVISLNMLRGRDADSNELRGILKSSGRLSNDIVKHRSTSWIIHLACMEYKRANGHLPRVLPFEFVDDFRRSLHYQVSSYRSKTSGQWFDSIVHRYGYGMPELSRAEWDRHRKSISENLSRRCRLDESVRGRIAALRAMRTMRLKGLQ